MIIKETSRFLARDFVVLISNLIIGIILARYLGPKILGTWYLIQSIFLIADSIFRSKAEVGSIYYIGKNMNIASNILSAMHLISLIALGLLTITLFFFSDIFFIKIFGSLDNNLISASYIVLIALAFSFFVTNTLYFLLAKKKYNQYNLVLILQSIINLLVVVTLSILYKPNVYIPVLALFFSWLTAFFISLLLTKLNTNKFLFSQPKKIKNLSLSGLKFYMTSFLRSSRDHFPRVILGGAGIDLSIIAYLGNVQLIQNIISKFPNAVSTLLYSQIASSNNPLEDKKSFIFVIKITTVVIFLVILLATIFSDLLVSILFGDQYIPLIEVLKIALPSMVLPCIGIVIIGYLTGKGDFTGPIYFELFACIPLIVLIFNNEVFFSGKALGWFIFSSNIMFGIISIIYIKQLYKFKLFEFIIKKSDLKETYLIFKNLKKKYLF